MTFTKTVSLFVVCIYFDMPDDRRNSIVEVFENEAEARIFLQREVEKFVDESNIPSRFHEYGDIIDGNEVFTTHRNVLEMDIVDSRDDALVAEADHSAWMFASMRTKRI